MVSTLSFDDFTEDPFPVHPNPTDDALDFEPTDLIGDTDYQNITVRDRPWIDVTDPIWGVSDQSSDNTAALQAACDAAITHQVAVVVPPTTEPLGYEVTGTIDLTDHDGITIRNHPSSVNRQQFLRGGHAPITNFVNNNPIFLIDGETAGLGQTNHVLEGLKLYGHCLKATGTRGLTLIDCGFDGLAVDTPITLVNSWDFLWQRCSFRAQSTAHKSITMIGTHPNLDVDTCYLMDFEDCWLSLGGVKYSQLAGGNEAGLFTFTRCITENMSAAAGSLLEAFAAPGTQLALLRTKFDMCEMADSTGGTPPMFRLLDSPGAIARYVKALDFSLCANQGINLAQIEDNDAIVLRSRISGCVPGADIMGADGVTPFVNMYGLTTLTDAGFGITTRAEYDAISDASAGNPGFAVRKAGDRHHSFAVGSDGAIRTGPTGATGSGSKFDSIIRRGGVGYYSVPFLVKAGVPADSDYVVAPPDGTVALNSMTDKWWYRKAGTWTVTA